MFNRYFQQELGYLKDLAAEFSKAHPAVAPMLSGQSTDPDAERLLEGVAFLTGLLKQKLDDEFPEIIHELIRLVFPHYLRPIPSATIMAFKPKPALKQGMTIPAGSQVASIPVEGTTCYFKTCFEVEVHPLELTDAKLVEAPGKSPVINIGFELQGQSLTEWEPGSLRLYLAGDYTTATDTYLLLHHYLDRIVVKPNDGGSPFYLSSENLKSVGFSSDEGLIPYPSHSFPAYRFLQEYFILPEKFLFLDITGWDKWEERGDGTKFEVSFELKELPVQPRIKRDNFVLFASPAINVFEHDADPIRIDHKKTLYHVRPSSSNPSHFQIYAIENVAGFIQGTAAKRDYVPFDCFSASSQSEAVYHETIKQSVIHGGADIFISLAYPSHVEPAASETLTIELECTNGLLPEAIRLGDISQPTSSSPEFVDFTNVRPPTVFIPPPISSNLLWRFLSHLSVNYASLADAENLRAIFNLYISEQSKDRTAVLANQKRVAGIETVTTSTTDRLVKGVMMRGRTITVNARQDHFAGSGDLYLFGCIMDNFLGAYASINTFTNLVVKEVLKGDSYKWPARIGDQPLI